MAESILLAAARATTFAGGDLLTGASGFFFERDTQLFFVTSRHVLIDAPTGHHPTHVAIEVHTDAVNLTQSAQVTVPLYVDGKSQWRQGRDSGGEIDVAAIEIPRALLPDGVALRCFTPQHLQLDNEAVEVGSMLLIVGFPLGFHDTLHHLPVARHGIIASSFGVRFQGQGFFLTDSRTHRGTSGACVVLRDDSLGATLPWRLLGVHSARMDMGGRDLVLDESLGLNSAWYANILMTLTAPRTPTATSAPPSAHS